MIHKSEIKHIKLSLISLAFPSFVVIHVAYMYVQFSFTFNTYTLWPWISLVFRLNQSARMMYSHRKTSGTNNIYFIIHIGLYTKSQQLTKVAFRNSSAGDQHTFPGNAVDLCE